MDARSYLVMVALWAASAAISGAVLAGMAKRMHPALSFRRLWVFYSALVGVFVAIVLFSGWF